MTVRWQLAAVLAAVAFLLIVVPASQALPIPNGAHRISGSGGIPPVADSLAEPAGSATGIDKPGGPDRYIIHLDDAPLAGYEGTVTGLPATSPLATGAQRLDTDAPASEAYLDYLDARHDGFVTSAERVLGRSVTATHRYRYAFNGVSLHATAEEAAILQTLPGVIRVERVTYQPLTTDVGPEWIGAPGIWDGTATGGLPGTKGEGIIVGVIDTGINMDHPSFAAVGGDGYEHENPFGEDTYVGWCDPENENYDPEYVCNSKLIGVWSFPESGMSPEDDNGHGSHTSSTAAGNYIADAKLMAPTVTISRTLSGVAPHANIIHYDACLGDGQGSCPSDATTAAIDQAVADGVHVINYSIGMGQQSPWVYSVSRAFLGAAQAGVFAACSGGNNGPNPSTVSATAPWVTAVAAATHDREWVNILGGMTGGDTEPPMDLVGKGFTDAYGPAPIVHAKGYVNGSGVEDDGQCLQAFPDGTWSGEIVVCDRGSIARVQKGINVLQGGAGGFVLANLAAHGNNVVADGHALPGVHLRYADADSLRVWLESGEGHMAELSGVMADRDPAYADIMAAFSSRGPALSTKCCARPDTELTLESLLDVVKPEVLAPGVNILAAILTNPANPSPDPEYGMISGTSMASPHVAGAGALLRALHPDWSVAQIKSALMSTAIPVGPLQEDGATPATIYDIGSGRIDVSRAAQAPLVLDIPVEEYEAQDPATGGSPATLNLASMACTSCLETCSWERTVTSTATEPISWTVSVEEYDGIMIEVSPEEFVLEPDEAATLEVTADGIGVMIDEWAWGHVILTPSDPEMVPTHMPVMIKSVVSSLPELAVIETAEAEGTHEITDVEAITLPEVYLTGYGLVKATRHEMSLEQDPTPENPWDLDDPTGTEVILFEVPEGARRLVAETPFAEAPDIDLFVGLDVNGNGRPEENELMARSGTPEFYELCHIAGPPPGNVWILVQNWEASEDAPDDVVLVYGIVEEEDLGNFTVEGPESTELGTPFSIEVGWTLEEMEEGELYYGLVDFGSTEGGSDLGVMAVDLISISEPTPARPSIYLPLLTKNHVLVDEEPTPEP